MLRKSNFLHYFLMTGNIISPAQESGEKIEFPQSISSSISSAEEIHRPCCVRSVGFVNVKRICWTLSRCYRYWPGGDTVISLDVCVPAGSRIPQPWCLTTVGPPSATHRFQGCHWFVSAIHQVIMFIFYSLMEHVRQSPFLLLPLRLLQMDQSFQIVLFTIFSCPLST